MDKRSILWIKENWDQDDVLNPEGIFLKIDASKVYNRKNICEMSFLRLAKCIGMSPLLLDLMLQLEICPAEKIDILASSLSIDKGELII